MIPSSVSPPTADHLAALAQWRALALEKMPYLASVLLRLDVWNAPGLGTYAVDRRWRLYIDFDHCIANETVQLGGESLLHECGHILGEHARIADELGVRTEQESKIWNVSGDLAWNDDLEAAGCAELAAIGVTPAKIGAAPNQTPQHYYAHLMKLAPQRPPQRGQQGGQQSGTLGQQQSQPAEPGQSAVEQNGQQYKGCGSGAGAYAAPCEFGDGDDTGSPISPIESKAILIDTAQQILKARGTAPASMVEVAELVLTPSRTPWQRLLSAHMRRAYAFAAGQVDQSYTRRARRRDNAVLRPIGGGPSRKMIKPGWVAPKPTIEAIVDTSGSMSAAAVGLARSEIEAIARRIGCRGESLTVTEVDARVQSSRKFTNVKALGGIHGRGGTDMRVGIRHALERRPRPDVIVILTDGETGWPPVPTPVPLIAVIIGVGAPTPPSWIRTVVVDGPEA